MGLPACFRGLALHLPDTLILDMRKDLHRVVAIDGPAASGKSSVARELARRLGFAYVNSGAIYRAITWHVLQNAIDPGDTSGVGTSGRLFFQTHPINFILMLHLKCVCAAVPRKGSGTKLRCVTTPILHGLSHRSSSPGTPMLSIRHC